MPSLKTINMLNVDFHKDRHYWQMEIKKLKQPPLNIIQGLCFTSFSGDLN